MPTGTTDGLGFEEVNQEVTNTAVISGTNVYGATSVQSPTIVASTSLSGTTVNASTVNAASINATTGMDSPTVSDSTGSPYNVGNVYTTFTAETNITGGMWVNVSGKAGGATMVARAAGAGMTPLGVATADVSSGATASILARGVRYMVAEDTLNNGTTFGMGVASELDTVRPSVSGTAGGIDSARGVVLAGAGSGGDALVYIW